MPPVIDLDDHRFYRALTLSYKFSAKVLRKVIDQYCTVHGLTFQQLLDAYKHELFHFWSGSASRCCVCFRRFVRVLLDKQWYSLFTDISSSLPPSHPHKGHDGRRCPDVFVARPGIAVGVCDVSLACALIANLTGTVRSNHVTGLITHTSVSVLVLGIPGLLEYTIDELVSSLGVNGFENFLTKHKHDLFHCMETDRCCQCNNDPNGKSMITQWEWRMMYNINPTPCTSSICSHQFSTIPGISRKTLKTHLLHKLGQSVGPLVTVRSVRNRLAHAATSSMDDPSFTVIWSECTNALHDLIDIVQDPAWIIDIKQQMATLQTCPINGEMWEEYHRNLQSYLEVCEYF